MAVGRNTFIEKTVNCVILYHRNLHFIKITTKDTKSTKNGEMAMLNNSSNFLLRVLRALRGFTKSARRRLSSVHHGKGLSLGNCCPLRLLSPLSPLKSERNLYALF
jgi:hypothetical protein